MKPVPPSSLSLSPSSSSSSSSSLVSSIAGATTMPTMAPPLREALSSSSPPPNQGTGGAGSAAQTPDFFWVCSACTLVNDSPFSRNRCDACNAPSPSAATAAAAAASTSSRGSPANTRVGVHSSGSSGCGGQRRDGSDDHGASGGGGVGSRGAVAASSGNGTSGSNELCDRVLCGLLSPAALVALPTAELARPELAKLRSKWDRLGTELRDKHKIEARLPVSVLFKCPGCGLSETRTRTVLRKADAGRFTTIAQCIHCPMRWEV
mmetsp:Transcript_47462/g.94110  ORF Transcript_47462/g.94110 Transcript_47462/m.94110 type:complete len:264 (+) Transcript_47462:860-1651(+)